MISYCVVLDEDGNGSIDRQELRNCFHRLQINFTDEEIDDLFEECDINEDMRIKFNEFIVLLCLVYLLQKDPVVEHSVSKALCILMCILFDSVSFC